MPIHAAGDPLAFGVLCMYNMGMVDPGEPQGGDDLRDRALEHLKKKRDFRTHVFMYVLVNAFLVGIWAVTGAGFFWPMFPILGWGIGLAANAWDVYARKPIREEDVRREMERLRG